MYKIQATQPRAGQGITARQQIVRASKEGLFLNMVKTCGVTPQVRTKTGT